MVISKESFLRDIMEPVPVLIWDSGEFQPEGDPEASLKKGKLTFSLKGKQIKGQFFTRPDERDEDQERIGS